MSRALRNPGRGSQADATAKFKDAERTACLGQGVCNKNKNLHFAVSQFCLKKMHPTERRQRVSSFSSIQSSGTAVMHSNVCLAFPSSLCTGSSVCRSPKALGLSLAAWQAQPASCTRLGQPPGSGTSPECPQRQSRKLHGRISTCILYTAPSLIVCAGVSRWERKPTPKTPK